MSLQNSEFSKLDNIKIPFLESSDFMTILFFLKNQNFLHLDNIKNVLDRQRDVLTGGRQLEFGNRLRVQVDPRTHQVLKIIYFEKFSDFMFQKCYNAHSRNYS